jgi:predicted ester cyclase
VTTARPAAARPAEPHAARPVRRHRSRLPDLQVTIEDDLIAEGDKVVARLTLTGTHTGPFAGQPASGHLARWSSIRIYRMDSGKVVQTWAMQDRLGLLQQPGALPELKPVNWADRSQRSATR